MKTILCALTFLLTSNTVNAIIGYDCSQQVSNLTTFSLINVGECDIAEPVVNTTKVYVRLLQLNDFGSTHVKLCKVEIKRSVKFCGAFSHRKDKNRGEVEFLDEITYEECKRMHMYRSHKVRDELISNLKLNGTVVYPMTFVGKVDQAGECSNAGTYSDPYGIFDDAIVTGYVTITLQDYYAPVSLDANEVVLRSGTRCKFNDDVCIDIEAGYAFWEPLPVSSCEEHKYSELYAGYVNKIIEEGKERNPVYVMESSEITFAFTAVGTVSVCSYDLVRTEHPKLFFFEGPALEAFGKLKHPTVHNLDIFAYVNSKFVYVEKHIKGELKRLYRDLIAQKCELEKRVISNALSIATTAPDLFAYQIMKKSGYMGLVAGEVVHLMKCVQVNVQRRETARCYQELPVIKDEKNYFLSPKTHILKQYGTETTCNPLIPPMFLLGEDWFTVLPHGTTKGIRPAILKPATKNNWNYTEPLELAKSGIYTQSDIQALRHHLMFPVERGAMLNSLAMGMSGRSVDKNGMSIARLFDEEALTALANNTWKRIWGQFLSFGSISAGIIGIIMIGRTIKFLVDTILHGYALYSLYGWSIHIIGAIWNSVTQLLLHAARDRPTRKEEKKRAQEDFSTFGKLPGSPPPAPLAPPLPSDVYSSSFKPHTVVQIPEGGEGVQLNCTTVDTPKLYPNLLKDPNIPSLPPRNKHMNDIE